MYTVRFGELSLKALHVSRSNKKQKQLRMDTDFFYFFFFWGGGLFLLNK